MQRAKRFNEFLRVFRASAVKIKQGQQLGLINWMTQRVVNQKWLAPIPPYFAVWMGLFIFKNAWAALLGFHLAILITLAFFRPGLSLNILFKNNHPRWIFTSVFLCGASGIGLYFFWDLFHVSSNPPEALNVIGFNPFSWMTFIAYFSLVNPLVEEYFWRGFLGSPSRSPYIGDFIFAGYHLLILWKIVPALSMLVALIFLSTAGWLWRQIHREGEGLLAPVLGHIAADFSILACAYLKYVS